MTNKSLVDFKNRPTEQPNSLGDFENRPTVRPNPLGDFENRPTVQPNPLGDFKNRPTVRPNPLGDFENRPTVRPNPLGDFKNRPTVRPLPDGWTWTTGRSLFKWASGKNLPQKKMRDGSVPVFGGNGIGGFHDESLVNHPTLVIGRVGAHCGNVHLTKGESWITDNAIYASELSDAISLKFAQIAFQLAKLNEQATGSGQPFVNQRMLNEVEFPLPPFPEQERIVAEIEKQFTRLDQAVASLRRLQSNLARYKASVLKAACDGRLVPQDPNDEPAADLLARILAERRAQWQAANPGKKYQEPVGVEGETAVLPDLPDGWVWATLDQCFDVSRGRFSVRPRNDPRYYDGSHPFVQIGDLPRDGGNIIQASKTLNNKGLDVSKKFPKGTVLIAIVGATIGNTGVLTFDSCSPDSLVAFQAQNQVRLQFLELYLRSMKHEIRAASYASGGQPNINLAFLLPYPMPVPPLAEQERIVAEVERRLSVVSAVEQTITANLSRAERLRQAILHRAFTGQL